MQYNKIVLAHLYKQVFNIQTRFPVPQGYTKARGQSPKTPKSFNPTATSRFNSPQHPKPESPNPLPWLIPHGTQDFNLSGAYPGQSAGWTEAGQPQKTGPNLSVKQNRPQVGVIADISECTAMNCLPLFFVTADLHNI